MPYPAPRPVIRWGLGDVFYGLLLWIAGGVAAAVVLLATGNVDVNTSSTAQLSLGLIAVSIASGWIGFLGWPLVATYTKGQRSLAKDFGLMIRWVDLGWGLLGGVAALAISATGSVLWSALSGESAPSNANFLPSKVGVGEGLALLLLVAVCTPIVEELFFRGLFLRSLGRRWNLPVAVVVSSLVFGMFHAEGPGLPHAAFIVAVTASYGAVFALLVVRAGGRLGPSIVAHAVVNGVAIAALFVA